MLISNCLTRLPSSLRPTTRECVYLVTHGHFLSRDKDGGHTIRSVIAKTPWYTQTLWVLGHVLSFIPFTFYIFYFIFYRTIVMGDRSFTLQE